MWTNTRNAFYNTQAVCNSCSKGNIDDSKRALAETDKIYVHILCSKCGQTPEMLSIKCRQFVILV